MRLNGRQAATAFCVYLATKRRGQIGENFTYRTVGFLLVYSNLNQVRLILRKYVIRPINSILTAIAMMRGITKGTNGGGGHGFVRAA